MIHPSQAFRLQCDRSCLDWNLGCAEVADFARFVRDLLSQFIDLIWNQSCLTDLGFGAREGVGVQTPVSHHTLTDNI